MRNRGRLLFVVVAIVVALAAPVLTPQAVALQSRVSWLHTSGTDIYDEMGRRLNLYGVNIISGQRQGVTLADIQTAKELGFNAIRLNSLVWGLLQPYNETLNGIDETFFSTGIRSPYRHGLDQIVNWAVQENMYVIICLGKGGSVWYPPPKWAFPGIGSFDTFSDAQRFAALINGTAARERTGIVSTWRYIADRYRDVPNVIFELLNEPIVFDESLAGSYYKTFNEEIISAIESVEVRSHLKLVELLYVDEVVYGNHVWMEATDTGLDIDKPNLLWATHHYDPVEDWNPHKRYWHGSFTWHGKYFPEGWSNGTTYVAWRLTRVAERILGWNKPWIVTEFSKNTTQTYWKDWFNVVLQTIAEYRVSGWMFFGYASDTSTEIGWNIKDPTTQQEIMQFLAPYLPADSGSTVVIAPVTTITTTISTTKLTIQVTNAAILVLVMSLVILALFIMGVSVKKNSQRFQEAET